MDFTENANNNLKIAILDRETFYLAILIIKGIYILIVLNINVKNILNNLMTSYLYMTVVYYFCFFWPSY